MSLKILYTGAVEFNTDQEDPSASTGYYISSTEVPSGKINALFPSISQQLSKGEMSRVTRALAVFNPTDTPIIDVEVFYNQLSKQPVSRVIMGIVAPAQDDCGGLYLEKVSSEDALPVHTSLSNNRGQVNSIIIPSIAPQSYVGLWMIREVSATRVNEPFSECEKMFERFDQEESSSIVEISTVADVGGSLDGQSFTLYLPSGKRYICVIDMSGSAIATSSAVEAVRFRDISTDDTAEVVAEKISTKLIDVLEFDQLATVTFEDDKITIEFVESGEVIEPSTSNSAFTFTTTQGASKDLEQLESLSLHFSW